MKNSYTERILLNMERMKLMRDLTLLDDSQETVYDQLTRLASAIIGTPVSLVSMVANDYQFFKSEFGLPEDIRSKRRTPLSHAFCKHVVVNNAPLIVDNAYEHELVKDNPGIQSLNIKGYLGMPLTLKDGTSLGSFCVTDSQPRVWTDVEIEIMGELAAIITQEFDLRVAVRARKASEEDLHNMHSLIKDVIDSLDPNDGKELFLETLKAAKAKYGF